MFYKNLHLPFKLHMISTVVKKLSLISSLALTSFFPNLAHASYYMPGVQSFDVPDGFYLTEIKQTYHHQTTVISGDNLKNLDFSHLSSDFSDQLKDFTPNCIAHNECNFNKHMQNLLIFTNQDKTGQIEVGTYGMEEGAPTWLLNSSMSLFFKSSYTKSFILNLFKNNPSMQIGDNSQIDKITDVKTGQLNGDSVVVFVGHTNNAAYASYPNFYVMVKFNSNNFSYVMSYANSPSLANQNLVYVLNHFQYTK